MVDYALVLDPEGESGFGLGSQPAAGWSDRVEATS